MTMFFLIVIFGAVDKRAPAGFAPLAIGLTLTIIRLVSIPVIDTSVNPARSTGVALFAGGWPWPSSGCSGSRPPVRGLLGAFAYKTIASDEP